jgi:hypothetical protein
MVSPFRSLCCIDPPYPYPNWCRTFVCRHGGVPEFLGHEPVPYLAIGMRTRTSLSRTSTVSTITDLLSSAGKVTPTYCLRDGWLSRGDA